MVNPSTKRNRLLKNLAEYAARWQDQWRPGEPGYGTVDEFDWSYQAEFPLALLPGERQEWLQWWEDEIQIWAEEGEPDRFDGMIAWWQGKPTNDPITVVQGTDGRWYPWDGMHRVGISYLLGMITTPAVVGVRR